MKNETLILVRPASVESKINTFEPEPGNIKQSTDGTARTNIHTRARARAI